MTTPTPTEPTQAPATPAQMAAYMAWCGRVRTRDQEAALLRDFVLSCLPPAIPEPGQRGEHGEWFAVYVTDCQTPNEPIALFEYGDQAHRFGESNYKGRFRVEKYATPPATPNVAEKPQPSAPDAVEKYAKALPLARAAARELGWAIGVHGSQVRDLDLIAVPWTEGAAPARELAIAIADSVGGYLPQTELDGRERAMVKPHNRQSWTVHLGGAWIDLAIVDSRLSSPPAPPTQASEGNGIVIGNDDWRLTARWRNDGGATFNIGSRFVGHEINITAADLARLVAAASPPPGVVTTHPLTHICDVPEFDPSEHRCPACNGEGSINCPHGCEPAPAKADGGRPKCPRCGKNDTVTEGGRAAGEFFCWGGCGIYFNTPAPSPPVGKVVIDLEVAGDLMRLLRVYHHHGRLSACQTCDVIDALSAAIAEAEAKPAESGVGK